MFTSFFGISSILFSHSIKENMLLWGTSSRGGRVGKGEGHKKAKLYNEKNVLYGLNMHAKLYCCIQSHRSQRCIKNAQVKSSESLTS